MTPPITLDQLEEGHALILGTTGSGKTYQLRGLLEHLRRADRRVGAVDKLGNHWGLTAARDGSGAGLEFVIFGGARAHVAMKPDQGERLGRLFVERSIPAIFDVSEWKRPDQEFWVAAFADAVFETNRTALHLAFDEAQSWVPQGGGGEAFQSVQRLAEQGRGRGIRLLLTCQRLSRLDATVRGMMHLVVAMRQVSTIDRKAVADLVASDRADQLLLEDLPKLATGTGFLWDPARAGLERIAFPENATFDSSRTPKHGDTPPEPIAVSSTLVDELRAALAPPAEPDQSAAAKAGDYPDDKIPADAGAAFHKGGKVGTMLRERDEQIAELQRRLAAVAQERDELEVDLAELDRQCDAYDDALSAIDTIIVDCRRGLERDPPISTKVSTAGDVTPHPRAEDVPSIAVPVGSAAVGGASDLPPRRGKILGAIRWSRQYLKRDAVPRTIVAWVAQASASSSSFANDLGALRSAGLVDYPSAGAVALTDAGLVAAPFVRKPQTRDELWSGISARLPNRQIMIVKALWNGRTRRREDVADDVQASATSSSFANDLGRLRTLGLIDYPSPGLVTLAELLR